MLTVLALVLSTSFLGPCEKPNEEEPIIEQQQIPDEVLLPIVERIIDEHPEIILKVLTDDKISEIIERVLLDKPEILRDNVKAVVNEDKAPVPVEDLYPAEVSEEPSVVNKSEEVKPVYELYLYTTDYCSPCERMKVEFINRQGEFPGQTYIGKNPTTFRDGFPVTQFPAAEVMKDGTLIKRFIGYTTYEAILEAVKE